MSNPFDDSLIRDWFIDSLDIDIVPFPVVTLGFSPFNQDDIDTVLKNEGFQVNDTSSISMLINDTFIVGRFGWSEDQLEELVEKHVGRELRIYSQEMFLSYIFSGRDPFDGSRKLLVRFAEGHPALEYLSDFGFDWPSTYVSGKGNTEIDDRNWPDIGLLKRMGYKVGKSGIQNAEKRRKILEKVYESSDLPSVKSREHMAEWGTPKSCKRLQKMANSLATFCRNAKRNSYSSQQLAITHWELDLQWLREKFYQGHCSFSWPSTYVDA